MSERPFSARFNLQNRLIRSSYHQIPAASTDQSKNFPSYQKTETAHSFAKKDPEKNSLPVQNITFQAPFVNNKKRQRKVLILKYLRSDDKQNNAKNSNRSMLKFFNVEEKKIDSKLRNNTIRPNSCRSNGPVTKRIVSDDFDSQGFRLFDINEVLSVTHGDINFKHIKLR